MECAIILYSHRQDYMKVENTDNRATNNVGDIWSNDYERAQDEIRIRLSKHLTSRAFNIFKKKCNTSMIITMVDKLFDDPIMQHRTPGHLMHWRNIKQLMTTHIDFYAAFSVAFETFVKIPDVSHADAITLIMMRERSNSEQFHSVPPDSIKNFKGPFAYPVASELLMCTDA